MRPRCLAVGGIPQAKPSTSFLSLLVDDLVFSGKLIHPELPPSLRLTRSVFCGTSTLDRGVRHLGAGAGPGQATDGYWP